MNFGKAVRIARSIAGRSQRELAEMARIDPSLVSLIESGGRQPSTATLSNISRALDMPVHVLTMLGTEAVDLQGIAPQEFEDLSQAIARLVLRDEPQTTSPRPARRRRPTRKA